MAQKKPAKAHGTDAPTCRLCGTRHWSNQPHTFKPTKKKRARPGPGRRDG